MARQIFALFLVVALMVSSASAQTCLGFPSVSSQISQGGFCGGVLNCAPGLGCDYTSTCNPPLAVGSTCHVDGDCGSSASCNGPLGSRKCVAYANPGETCTTSPTTNSSATCQAPSPAGCSSNGVCLGAFGDKCTNNNDCNSGFCTGGICLTSCGSPGCTSEQICNATNSCVSLPTSGPCYQDANCAPGYTCIHTDATETVTECVKVNSVANGDWCDGNEVACTSGLCYRSKCQANNPVYCNNLVGCTYGSMCLCSNAYFATGFGTCGSEACYDSFFQWIMCVSNTCNGFNPSYGYTNACANQNCQTQKQAYMSCDPQALLLAVMSG